MILACRPSTTWRWRVWSVQSKVRILILNIFIIIGIILIISVPGCKMGVDGSVPPKENEAAQDALRVTFDQRSNGL